MTVSLYQLIRLQSRSFKSFLLIHWGLLCDLFHKLTIPRWCCSVFEIISTTINASHVSKLIYCIQKASDFIKKSTLWTLGNELIFKSSLSLMCKEAAIFISWIRSATNWGEYHANVVTLNKEKKEMLTGVVSEQKKTNPLTDFSLKDQNQR